MYCVKEKLIHSTVFDRNPLVLIVDDDRVNTELLDDILRQEGYGTVVARNGVDAFALVESMRPDLILLDILMPGIDGFEVCRQIHENTETSNIPIIFMSAMTGVKSKIRGFGAGAVDYITKPFDRNEVAARTKSHLARSLKERQALAIRDSRLDQVRQAQQSLLVCPDTLPQAGFAVEYMPVCEASGDFYDVIDLGCQVFGYLVADVSGHDIGASFTTPALKAVLRQIAATESSIIKIFNRINQSLKPILGQDQYLTACYAVVDRANGKLKVVNAGHPPMVLSKAHSVPEFIHNRGDVLGAFDEVDFELREFDIAPGDELFLYSDGLIERFLSSMQTRQQAVDKLIELIGQSRGHLGNGALARICRQMSECMGPLEDDVVLMGVQV